MVAFYKSNLKNVKNEQSMTNAGTKMTMFTFGEGKDQVMVHVTRDTKEERTMIQVMKAGAM